MISELAASERWAWVGILLMAGDSNEEGRVFLRKDTSGNLIGYSNATLAELLGLEPMELESAKSKMIKYDKISIDENHVIHISNWKKYQSEYARQKPYRESDEKNSNLECNQSNTLELDIDKEIDIDKEKSPKLKFTDSHLSISRLLEKGINERLPKYKIKGDKYLENWSNVFRIMIENKEATRDEIEKLICWIFRDSDFWYKNILSADKFRKQFGRLWEEMGDDKPKRDTVGQQKKEPAPEKKKADDDYVEARLKKMTQLEKKYALVAFEECGFEEKENMIQNELAKWTKEYYDHPA